MFTKRLQTELSTRNLTAMADLLDSIQLRLDQRLGPAVEQPDLPYIDANRFFLCADFEPRWSFGDISDVFDRSEWVWDESNCWPFYPKTIVFHLVCASPAGGVVRHALGRLCHKAGAPVRCWNLKIPSKKERARVQRENGVSDTPFSPFALFYPICTAAPAHRNVGDVIRSR